MSLRIPPPPAARIADPAMDAWLAALYAELGRLDAANRKLQRDVEITFTTTRLILPDETGARYSVTVDSVGPTVIATVLP